MFPEIAAIFYSLITRGKLLTIIANVKAYYCNNTAACFSFAVSFIIGVLELNLGLVLFISSDFVVIV